MKPARSTLSAPPPILAWGELSGKPCLGFTSKNLAWNPGPSVVNSTTAIGLQAGLFLEGFRQSDRARYYNPQTGRFLSEDPVGFVGGDVNLYTYAKESPPNFIDPTGLATYVTNRQLAAVGDNALPRWDPISHPFTFSTNPHGSIAATYSWGNGANLTRWNLNQPEDMAAAAQALQKRLRKQVGDDSMDRFYQQVFDQLNNPASNHTNLIVGRNCKTDSNGNSGAAALLPEPSLAMVAADISAVLLTSL